MKKYKIPGLIIALVTALGLSGAAVNTLHAATTNGGGLNPIQDLVNAIAQKFNLNPSDVQAVFDAEKTKMEASREVNYEARIAGAVSAGKLTQTQGDLIIAKHKELEANRENLKGLTRDEIRTKFKAEMDSLKTWAQDNNIPLEYLRPESGHGHIKGIGMGEFTLPPSSGN